MNWGNGGGICIKNSTVDIHGTCYVKGNYYSDIGGENVYLAFKKLTIRSGATIDFGEAGPDNAGGTVSYRPD